MREDLSPNCLRRRHGVHRRFDRLCRRGDHGQRPIRIEASQACEYERLATKRALGENYFEVRQPDGTYLYGDKRVEGSKGYKHGHFGDGAGSRDGMAFDRRPTNKLGAGAIGDFRTEKERTRRWPKS